MVAYSGIRKLLNDLYDSNRILEQPFFQIICLFVHLFTSTFDVGRSMFDVRPFGVRRSSFQCLICPAYRQVISRTLRRRKAAPTQFPIPHSDFRLPLYAIPNPKSRKSQIQNPKSPITPARFPLFWVPPHQTHCPLNLFQRPEFDLPHRVPVQSF